MTRNTAQDLDKSDIMEEILCHMEAFTDDILPAMNAEKLFRIDVQVNPCVLQELVIYWSHYTSKNELIKKTIHRIRYSVCDTKEGFIDRFKSYLFSLLVMIENLSI
jgi:hypothetical protein